MNLSNVSLLNVNVFVTLQQVVELNGYVIIVVESRDNKIKLYGSPADRDNLEVGDEILDVNERKLEDLPRADVIRYIHEVNYEFVTWFCSLVSSIDFSLTWRPKSIEHKRTRLPFNWYISAICCHVIVFRSLFRGPLLLCVSFVCSCLIWMECSWSHIIPIFVDQNK